MAVPISRRTYIVGLLILFTSAYSQYLLRGGNSIFNMAIVYGIPVLAVSLLWGSAIIDRALHQTLRAIKFGLGVYGLFTALGTLAAIGISFLLIRFDPSAVNLLHKPNPVLHTSPEHAWIMVGVSFLIIGPVEEYLFRGFVYGGLLSLFRNRHWLSLAFVSAILFAAVHLYYGIVYGIASIIPFTDLVAFGMAMAVTYYLSDGNILIPALIHGLYDATGFLGVATSSNIGAFLRSLLMVIGVIIGIVIFVQRRRKKMSAT